MSMSVADNNAVVQASKARREAGEEFIVRAIRDQYVIERIMRLVRQKAMRSDNWKVKIRLTWAVRFAFLNRGLDQFAEDYIKLELERHGFDIPLDMLVIGGQESLLRFPFRPFVFIRPVETF